MRYQLFLLGNRLLKILVWFFVQLNKLLVSLYILGRWTKLLILSGWLMTFVYTVQAYTRNIELFTFRLGIMMFVATILNILIIALSVRHVSTWVMLRGLVSLNVIFLWIPILAVAVTIS